ncbi:MAG: HAMP domain-containing sensor histidine kinase [Methylocystis sp.]
MKFRRSVTFRLITHLVPAQILAVALGWVVGLGLELGGFRSFSSKIDTLALGRTENLLIASLLREADGTLRIEPTAALREEMQRVPTLRLAVYDLSRKMTVSGSAAELTPLLVDPPAISLVAMTYFLADDSGRLAEGSVSSKSTAFGELRLAIYGERFCWDDPFLLLGVVFTYYWPYVFVGVLLCSAGTWLAVRRGLAPLRDVAADAARIDIDGLDQRLFEGSVPVEILPLVGAFNDTLARLDAGVGGLRRFIANAAHELRTPLAILSMRLGAPEEPTFKKDLKRDLRRAQHVVDQLLATARLAERSIEVLREVDLVSIAKSVASDAAMVAIKHRRRVEFEAPSAPVIIHASEFALQSVIANLVDNALRAEPEGGMVKLLVGVDAIVEVVDHGEGVAGTDRDLIFEPFWRKSEQTPGAGLGLAIAKELMGALGGRIWVEETLGGGATFKLSFPKIASGDQSLPKVGVNARGLT